LPPFALTLDHGLSDLAELRTKLAQWLLDAGVSAESSASLVLAAHEATANAAQHSNAETPVEANAWLTGPDVVIEVEVGVVVPGRGERTEAADLPRLAAIDQDDLRDLRTPRPAVETQP
jgi:hypothetical protein